MQECPRIEGHAEVSLLSESFLQALQGFVAQKILDPQIQ